MATSKPVWAWLERIGIVVAILLGIVGLIGFLWQVEDRRSNHEEEVAVLLSQVKSIRDSQYSLVIDVSNTGRKPIWISRVGLQQTQGKRFTGDLDYFFKQDTAQLLQIQPDSVRRFHSRSLTWEALDSLGSARAEVVIETVNKDHILPLDSHRRIEDFVLAHRLLHLFAERERYMRQHHLDSMVDTSDVAIRTFRRRKPTYNIEIELRPLLRKKQ
jgi:hypothetical protein